ncbi:enoyl-CoA hydratase/carnithine racemase [Amycolatopsis bartoniae]|uniref:Enoyl-CoA hydratase n=1 Tax=Amycolatopsis bartoniae TaxID=941986 RepID=A0A8H9J380_9PSEU|nr:enoyl-CoA hydratase-related protein [Amycolatopsis bartoniae]MBB2936554.1 enoyl-CoA hydratase/carnithine racemase [Amycolatopsis bartoniae]TVT10974.1 enoyl-CoA hydratase [Amycolatopsis bartoniae]GHF68099.1 enoyl-CoA hydratase [Amycolatopsis bartoniae]
MNDERPLVTTSLADGVLTITLDAPHTGNALDIAMTEALAGAIEDVKNTPDAHCVLLRSSGRHFCTGGNVKDMARGADLMAGTTTDIQDRLRLGLHRITRALRDLEVPSVAAVNGAAVGAGFDLALMCDVRIAARSARFAESFLRLGLVSGIGGAWFLARAVGVAKAMELTLTSEFISAETAAELRIVSRVVDDDRLRDEAAELARTIAAQPPRALRMAKRLVRESAETTLPAALELAAAMQAILLSGDEHRTTVKQFLENRR